MSFNVVKVSKDFQKCSEAFKGVSRRIMVQQVSEGFQEALGEGIVHKRF